MKKTSSPASTSSQTAASTPAPSVVPANLRPSHEEIAGRARQLWSDYGQPSGRDEEIWLEAERQLRTPGERTKVEETARQLAPKSTGTSSVGGTVQR
jgi:hypothetical protein